MEKIGTEVEIPNRGKADETRASFNIHGSERGRQRSTAGLSGLQSRLAGGEKAVGDHQDGDERQEKDGVGGVILAVLCRYSVARGFEDQPPNRRDHHAIEKPSWRRSQ